MDNKLLTLAIHTPAKAHILKQLLEEKGIRVSLDKVEKDKDGISPGLHVRVKEEDLSAALSIIEEYNLFSYNDEDTYKVDDGRKRILVAVDFSDYSYKACQIAFGIAKDINAKVKILHVYHHIYFPSSIPFADTLKEVKDEGLLNKSRRQMLQLCCDIDEMILNEEWPCVNYSYSLREGNVEDEIENFIEEYKPILLVLGTKGKDNNKTDLLGRVTADIIEMTSTPIIAVPENSPINSLGDIQHVALLTSLQKRDRNDFNFLVNILKPYSHIKLTLVHLNLYTKKGEKWSENDLIKIKEHFKSLYPGVNVEYKLIDTSDMIGAVHDFIQKENVNILALNTRRRSMWGRMFLPSVSRKMLDNPDICLFILRG